MSTIQTETWYNPVIRAPPVQLLHEDARAVVVALGCVSISGVWESQLAWGTGSVSMTDDAAYPVPKPSQ